MNSTTGRVAVTDEQTKKYLTLLELSKAIASHRDLAGLFHILLAVCGIFSTSATSA